MNSQVRLMLNEVVLAEFEYPLYLPGRTENSSEASHNSRCHGILNTKACGAYSNQCALKGRGLNVYTVRYNFQILRQFH
jgi:hypothetical protein